MRLTRPVVVGPAVRAPYQRSHDVRRTFIKLARSDGARKDVLEWITHGPRGDIVDLYTTLPWELLCGAVSLLKIELRTGKVIAFPKIAQAGGGDVVGRFL